MADRLTGSLFDHPTSPRLRNTGAPSIASSRRMTIIEFEDGHSEAVDTTEEGGMRYIIENANMDGVRHLSTGSTCSRIGWTIIILIFVILALVQIISQFKLFFTYPIATNIEAEYPSSIVFPTVAICNNNQFRLTYVTGATITNRKVRKKEHFLTQRNKSSASVFDRVIERTWDMDAVRFLRSAAHWKSRMILGCTWPNGTACRTSDFSAVWTMTGLCWAINTNQHEPVHVTGSGAAHGLRLLLNVESYERIDACTPHFRTKSIPGLKILIYNQTDIPESSMSGVNVPPGYTMDIPFKMQHRNKLPGLHCVAETQENINARSDFHSELNIGTCVIRRYLNEVERQCNCSMRRLFPNPSDNIPYCNVDEYFGCVQGVMRRVQEGGTNIGCQPSCNVIDYTAWQDMNHLPQNLMPALIEEHEEDDETEVAEDEVDDERYVAGDEGVTYSCDDSSYLDERQVLFIKKDANRAYEKQSRYQEDIFLRTRRLITRLRAAIDAISRAGWGWHGEDFIGVKDRLDEMPCFLNFSQRHESVISAITHKSTTSEEAKAAQLHKMLDEEDYKIHPNRYKSIGDVRAHYGDKLEPILKEIASVQSTIEKLWSIFDSGTFTSQLTSDFSRMDRILQLMRQYDGSKLQRRVWAEKMAARQMRHFFEEEFYDGWYQPIMRDLDQSLVKVIMDIENEEWPRLNKYIENGTAIKTGAILFFDDPTKENMTKFFEFLLDMHKCTSEEIKQVAVKTLRDFKKMFRVLQSSYNNLFKKELPDYLENFEFGSKFVNENFAMVNIFLHHMHLERWSQVNTYTWWSFACDVGGTLGLFLGASLLTVVEIGYLCFRYGLYYKCWNWLITFGNRRAKPKGKRVTKIDNFFKRVLSGENKSPTVKPAASYDPSVSDMVDKTPIDTPHRIYAMDERPRRPIWVDPDHPDRVERPHILEDYLTHANLNDHNNFEEYRHDSPQHTPQIGRLKEEDPNERLPDISEETSKVESDPKSEDQGDNRDKLLSQSQEEPSISVTDSIVAPEHLLFRGKEQRSDL